MASHFPTTRKSLLVQIKSTDSWEAENALDTLCRTYWLPLYSWLRRNGNTPENAEELTQDFFAHVIQKEIFHKVDPAKGKLRSFLLLCLTHFLDDLNEKDMAHKRQGRSCELSLSHISWEIAEAGLEMDFPDPRASPAEIYDYRWARALMQSAMSKLREEHVSKGKENLYRVLNPLLSELEPGKSYSRAARELQTSEGAIRIAFHRFKTRFRDLVCDEVAATLAPGESLEEELQYLRDVIADTKTGEKESEIV